MTDQPTENAAIIPEAGHGLYVLTISLLAAMGGLLFGYDWIVISGADLFYEKYFELTDPKAIGWAKGSALVGCFVGALSVSVLCDRLGRKKMLLASALFFAVSAFGTALADSFEAFVFWRIVGGIGVGQASNLSPMYIAEAAPAKIRGKLVTTYQLAIVIGIVVAQMVNSNIAQTMPDGITDAEIVASWNGQQGWRWMFAAEGLPAMLFFIGLIFIPESPRWLVKNHQIEKARAVLTKIGGKVYGDYEVEDIRSTLAQESTGKVEWRELFKPGVRNILVFGLALSFMVQWCGINIIFTYAKDVFISAGYKETEVIDKLAIIGWANFAFTVVAIFMIDRLGRRPLMLMGWLGLSVIFTAIGLVLHMGLQGFVPVALVVTAISCYACTLAPVYWVVVSELFPNRVRGMAMGLAVFVMWVGNFSLTQLFPVIFDKFGMSITLWVFAAICLLGFVVVLVKLPETKGKTLEDIERSLT